MLLDQYGNLMPEAGFTAVQYNGNDEITLNGSTEATGGYYSGVAVASAVQNVEAAGSYVVQVEATDGDNTVTKKFSVNLRKANTDLTPTYKVELSTSSIDMNPELRSVSNHLGTVTAKVATYYGTVFGGFDTGVSNDVEFAVKSGSKYFQTADVFDRDSANYNSTAATVVTGASATINTVTESAANTVILSSKTNDGIAENGTYTVSIVTGASVAASKVKSATFTVKNTMEVPTVTVNSTKGDGDGATAADVVDECVTVDIAVLGTPGVAVVQDVLDSSYAQASISSSNKVTAKYIVVNDVFYGTYTYVYYVQVGKQFTK
jgi:hypothetical protein